MPIFGIMKIVTGIAFLLFAMKGSYAALSARTNLLPPFRAFFAPQALNGFYFDYTASSPPSPLLWAATPSNLSTSSGVLLTIPASSQYSGSFTTYGKATANVWRTEITLKLTYIPTGGKCQLFGFILGPSSPQNIPLTNNTIGNYQGFSFWAQICPFGNVTYFFSEDEIDNFSPLAAVDTPHCASCKMPATLPSTIDFILQMADERLTVISSIGGVTFPDYCFSHSYVNGYEDFAILNPPSMQLVALYDQSAAIAVTRFVYYVISKGNVALAAWPNPSTGFLLAPPPSPYNIYMEPFISFSTLNNPSSRDYFNYWNNSAVIGSNINLVPNQTDCDEGSISTKFTISTGMNAFRFEIWFTLLQIPTATKPVYFNFILGDNGSIPLTAGMISPGRVIPGFRGYIVQFGIGVRPDNSLYFASNVTSGPLNGWSQCGSCQDADYSAANMISNSTPVILAIQLFQDKLTFAFQLVDLSGPTVCFSNFPVPGIGAIMATGNSSIQLLQQNNGNNATLLISQMRYFHLAPTPLPTTTQPTTTSTTTALKTTTSPANSTAGVASNVGNSTTPGTTQAGATILPSGVGNGTVQSTTSVLTSNTATTRSNTVSSKATTKVGSSKAPPTGSTQAANSMISAQTTQAMTSTDTATSTQPATKTAATVTIPPIDDLDSGFPVPSLIIGHQFPMIDVQDLLQCPYIQPEIRSPNLDNATVVYFSMVVDRLIDIKDLEETISIAANVNMRWGVFTCEALYCGSSVGDAERVIAASIDDVWHPTVKLANSSDDIYMENTKYSTDIQILYLPTNPNRTLYFYWNRLGIITSKCALDLRKFPFDEQTCDFTFQMREPVQFVSFGGVYVSKFSLPSTSSWILGDYRTRIGQTMTTDIGRTIVSSYVAISVSFVRNASFQMYNLVAPSLILIAMVLGSFIMPPKRSDRSVLTCTVLLAFGVAQTQVLQEVPHTSQRILLADYLLGLTGLTAAVTIFDMAMCKFTYHNKQASRLIGVSFHFRSYMLRLERAIDICTFLISVGILAIIHVYAASVVLDD